LSKQGSLRACAGAFLLLMTLLGVLSFWVDTLDAQELVTATPAVIILPTDPPIGVGEEAQVPGGSGEILLATATWTPSGPPPVILEALDIANVRSLPDTTATQLGVIRSGDFYTVLGQYGNWIQLQYDTSPTGFGWVYGELVRITGDTAAIAQVDPYLTPEGADAGLEAGGVVATATLSAQELITSTPIVLPTFTFPPGVIRPLGLGTPIAPTAEPTSAPLSEISSAESLPPIAPILIMGGLGLAGLVLVSLRRS